MTHMQLVAAVDVRVARKVCIRLSQLPRSAGFVWSPAAAPRMRGYYSELKGPNWRSIPTIRQASQIHYFNGICIFYWFKE